ncbi:MAG: hypothetical protein QM682_12185 [Paracoccus sp. (in: a-proteobacteria)]|uniref:hypothetical protein n=1 Tax=Paracoccus sp. TaxID=267 RepID=UPI0039E3883B
MFGFINFAVLRSCMGHGWTPVIGDPEITGWLTVISYGLCFVLATAVLLRRPVGAALGLWLAITLLMAFLGVNKQLDLQTALTATGRCVAHTQGWYDDRAWVQLSFIALLVATVVLALCMALRQLRGRLRRNGLALLGLTVLCGFVLARAVGFHDVDSLISMNFANVKFNFWFENSGLVLIAVNAWRLIGRGRAPRPNPLRPPRPSFHEHLSDGP